MPYCTQCGKEVLAADRFCAACGSEQSVAGGTAAAGETRKSSSGLSEWLRNLEPQKASTLCYVPVVGWVMSIVVLAADRFRDERETRFHAFQGLYLFVLWLFVDWVFSPIMSRINTVDFLGHLFKAVVLGTWIFMLVKTSQGQMVRLPIIGELADRSVSEQK
jgi:uncharacterized membrane protein